MPTSVAELDARIQKDAATFKTIVEKAKLLAITRQAWYFWMHGACRPNAARSKQLEKITGFPWRDIKG